MTWNSNLGMRGSGGSGSEIPDHSACRIPIPSIPDPGCGSGCERIRTPGSGCPIPLPARSRLLPSQLGVGIIGSGSHDPDPSSHCLPGPDPSHLRSRIRIPDDTSCQIQIPPIADPGSGSYWDPDLNVRGSVEPGSSVPVPTRFRSPPSQIREPNPRIRIWM